MKIKEYQVIAPNGVVWNGNIVVQGGTIAAPTADGRIKAYLHFRQVRENATVAEIGAARESVAPVVGTLSAEPGQTATLVDAATELPIIGAVSAPVGGGEFVAVPVGVVAAETADDSAAELGEAAALARAKRKTTK